MVRISWQRPLADDRAERPGTMESSTPISLHDQRPALPPSAEQPGLLHSLSSLSSSIALRFNGFTATLEALIDPLAQPLPPRLASDFFIQKAPEIAQMAMRNPAAAHRIIAQQLGDGPRLWRELLLVSCGDGTALARALDAVEAPGLETDARSRSQALIAVAGLRPLEGRHLLRHAFAHADLGGQLEFLRQIVANGVAGAPQLIGELFTRMMEGTNRSEREQVVYPALFQIIAGNRQSSPRAGFLAAFFRGWLSEDREGEADTALLSRLEPLIS